MAATLTIVDLTNGTGATATLAGTLGAAVSLYVAQVSGLAGALPFALAGTRVGDGSLVLAPQGGFGLYFGYALVGGVPTNLVYFAVTSGAQAVATRVRRSVVNTIKLLPLPFAKNVYEQILPDETNIRFPCAICTVDGVSETEEQVFSVNDDIGRPVKILIADRATKMDHARLPDYELWRQAVDRCFRNQQLAGVVESVRCKIEPYTVIDPTLREYQHMVTALTVRAICREPRGVGVL